MKRPKRPKPSKLAPKTASKPTSSDADDEPTTGTTTDKSDTTNEDIEPQQPQEKLRKKVIIKIYLIQFPQLPVGGTWKGLIKLIHFGEKLLIMLKNYLNKHINWPMMQLIN